MYVKALSKLQSRAQMLLIIIPQAVGAQNEILHEYIQGENVFRRYDEKF